MRIFMIALALLALPSAAQSQAIAVSANLEIFDGVSRDLQKERGRLYVDDYSALRSGFRLTSASGQTLCSGTRTAGFGGGTFRGKCFGYPARGNYTQNASGLVRMKWTYKNSWIKLQARVE